MGQESSKPYHSDTDSLNRPEAGIIPHGLVPKVNIPPPKSEEPCDDRSQTLEFTPQKVHTPKTAQDIYNILKHLKDDEEVSVIASRHSCSRMWINKTNIITLDFMEKVFEDMHDRGKPAFSKVRVSANMVQRDCLKRLAEHGRTLPGTGGVDEQQLGGLLGTFTAPASKELTIYEDVISIEYVTKHNVNNVAEGELLKVLKGNLGLVGVVTFITLGTRPNYGMKAIQRILPVKDLIKFMAEGKNFVNDDPDEPEDQGKEYPFWRFDCIPQLHRLDGDHTPGSALLWAARKVDAVENRNYTPDGDYVSQYKTMPLSMLVFTAIQKQNMHFYKFETYNDMFTSSAYLMMGMITESQKKENTFYGPLRNMLPVDRFLHKNVTCAMAEWAFKPSDIHRVLPIYKAYFGKDKWPNLPIEVEYVKCDDSYMSPWNSSKMPKKEGERVDYLIKVNLMWFYSKPKERTSKDRVVIRREIEDHAKGLWNKLKDADICFKAHWGKINFTTPKDVEELYEWHKFKDYIQPQMMNDYFRERLPHKKKPKATTSREDKS